MGLLFRKVKTKLSYKDDQPEVYKVQKIIYPQVTFEQLVHECSNSCGVNPSQTKAVMTAVLDRMVHYMEIGHGVRLGDFGSFTPKIRVKTALSADEANIDTIQQKVIGFVPGKDFRNMLKNLTVESASETLDRV